MSFEQLAQDLQEELALVDLLNSTSSWDGNISLMVKKLDPVELRMSPDKNHFARICTLTTAMGPDTRRAMQLTQANVSLDR